MYCHQCEQTFQGTGCTKAGVCGKSDEVATLQDLLLYSLKGLATVTQFARQEKIDVLEANQLICKGLFDTVTNVSFDSDRLIETIRKVITLRDQLKIKLPPSLYQSINGPVSFELAATREDIIRQGKAYGIFSTVETDEDIRSLKTTLIFGLKGMAAYADHAAILGQHDDAVYQFMEKALSATLQQNLSLQYWLDLLLECGKHNLTTMALLDKGNTEHYGHPKPTEVPLGPHQGHAILVSGHDLHDLELLLEQTKSIQNLFIYTHGEMLPTHAYPTLKSYSHFYGHYGTAWQNQQKEFAAFPGAILMTTNCIQKPSGAYEQNIFTTGEVAFPGVSHLADKNFEPLIKRALELPGFPETINESSVTVGFGHHTVLSIADKIIDAVKSKKIRHFFLVAGCDGAKPGRNYYTELVEKIPEDCIVLTLACGKFRFFTKKLGDIDGIPRLIDIGQCNDAFSAIQIAVALANAFNVGVNDLPLSLILSWYEQKAVAILLTLLSLGIQNIRLGPSLPAFLSKNVLNVLTETFHLKAITTPDTDLKAILS